ncbi:hypothetical protein Mesau_05541 [Mesorhizobium australicum WSM2073]|uniref:Uncharacterized protein n=3 Tax=Mesorhizobium TaxID=68287 RepID=L0KRW7_MESAW|nr:MULTISPECIES: hypothetical protein [Mesorhizobium]ADV14591.1 hypothetical protein Mesci_5494 [Mesorhizobium ciceri biovar biserrulae WSM1271]AEH90476.1 hypothetical protein Mesop_6074 [Mesorhizobium opportunistum WSM2075]AGB47846.1 hypothetical protein Mesau_05541 [Mesorhizobium australicum WSM2073]OBP90045.1 hypothetical protein BAE40_14210 [Mesorhizobium loti]
MAPITAKNRKASPEKPRISMRSRQRAQYEHDLHNHLDILSLSRADRLKHYGLHFAKYAGRFARGDAEVKTRSETLVDAFLVVLSAANALNQRLPDVGTGGLVGGATSDLAFTDHAGRFADACEKIDHLEEFRAIALAANAALSEWIVHSAKAADFDLDALVDDRRRQLARRQVYAQET